MLVNTYLPIKLCKHLNYHHQLDIIENNAQTIRYVKKYKQDLIHRTKTTHTLPHCRINTNYNKYYIESDMKYKKKSCNPKLDKNIIHKNDYFYKNLYNEQFWNWNHPLENNKKQINKISKQKNIDIKIDLSILEKFKKRIQNNPQKRVPLAVQMMLSKRTNK